MKVHLGKYKKTGAKRQEVHIDNYDVWALDYTLALIIHPALIKLKEQKHGAPIVDDEDLPEEIRSTNAASKEDWSQRWDWVLDEMIWAFGEIKNANWEDQYHSGEHDILFVPVDEERNEVPEKDAKLFSVELGPNDTHQFDEVGYHAHQDKIQNGLRLFAKYYFSLWD